MATSTTVSKASPAIKQIIAATVGAKWPGKKVFVDEVHDEAELSWFHCRAPKPSAWYLNLSTLRARPISCVRDQNRAPEDRDERFGHWMAPGPSVGAALVYARVRGVPLREEVRIIVHAGTIDASAVSVATDALLAGDKKGAAATAKLCGATGGLCLALAEANAKTLGKGEGGEGGKTKKSAAQLQREIDAALSRR